MQCGSCVFGVPFLLCSVGPVCSAFHFSYAVWVLCVRRSISLMQCWSCVFGVPFLFAVWVLCIRRSVSLTQCGSCVFGVPFILGSTGPVFPVFHFLCSVRVLCFRCSFVLMLCRSCVFGVLLPLCSVGPVFPVFHFAYAVWVHLRTLCITLNNVEPCSQVLYSSQGKTWVPHTNNQHRN